MLGTQKIRIGIVGSDSSHADAFAKLVNLPDDRTGMHLFPDFEINCIFGLDKKRNEEVASKWKIGFIAEKPEELMGMVDAVMVVFRHGGLHMDYALPFIEAGIPTWVDKPFCIKSEDARKLIDTAAAKDTLLAGGSCLKYIDDVIYIRNLIEKGGRIGKLKSAVVNFPATLENEYGGIHFYGSHLADMTMKAFGYDVRSVTASENNGCVAAVAKYDKYQVVMNFISGPNQYLAILYGENGVMVREIDITGCYIKGFIEFANMIRSGKSSEKYEQLYAPVKLLNAVVQSYNSGTEIILYPY